jgi:hypothetical protein
VLFRKEYAEAKYCPKCKSSRFMDVDSGDGQKRRLDIPLTILRHLPFILRIQRLYMTEESTKQMACKLEKIFPPGFFNPMQHLILHLLYEARMGGPCRDVGAIQSRHV